jgi:hypothetical protein
MSLIPTFEYQDAQGNPVASTSDPAWKYTVISGGVRTVKDGAPEHLVGGKWMPIEKPAGKMGSGELNPRDSTADTEPPAPSGPVKAKAKK